MLRNLNRKILKIACLSVIVISQGCTPRDSVSKQVESPILGVWEQGETLNLTAPKDCILITQDHYVELAEK